MQPAARTPSSILRKRPNKENEDATGKIPRRNKLANRRVSFAPDDELETKHIFDVKDSDRSLSGDLRTADCLDPGQGVVGAAQPLHAPPHGPLLGDPLAVLPSPDNLSPLSMDLTNNSFEQPCGATTAGPSAGGGLLKANGGGIIVAGISSQNHQQQQQQQHHHQHHSTYARMDITMNVPNLSTLVEEDEEGYAVDDVSSHHGTQADNGMSPRAHVAALHAMSSSHLPPDTPMSPNSFEEMQRCTDREQRLDRVGALPSPPPPSPQQGFWPFAPGRDDTLDVNHGLALMGDKTYSHVYGAASTGEITRAIGDRLGGPSHHITNPAAITRLLAAGAAPRDASAADDARSPARAAPETGTAAGEARGAAGGVTIAMGAVAPGHGQLIVAVERMAQPQTLRQVHAQEQHHVAQRIEASAVPMQPQPSLHVPQALAPQLALQTRVQAPHSTPFLDNTTRLLEDDQTEAWRLPVQTAAYDRGRLSVASNRVLPPASRRGAGGGGETTMLLGPTMTLASAGVGVANTVQLLADDTNQRNMYERSMQDMPGCLDSPAVAPPLRLGAGGCRPACPPAAAVAYSVAADQRAPAVYHTSSMSMELKAGAGGDDLLDDGGLSLDAFAVPPEPTMALSQLQAADQQGRNMRPARGGANEPALSAAASLMHGRTVGMQAAALAAAASRAAPGKLTYQDFLSTVDLSFIDKICRESFAHVADPAPKTVAEVYEATTVTAAYVETYHDKSLDLAARLPALSTQGSQAEAELTANKQDLFQEVQMASPCELEAAKEKFAGLKELCRVRTAKQIKQAQRDAMRAHLEMLEAIDLQLKADAEGVTGGYEKLKRAAGEVNALPPALTRMRQEDEERMQEAEGKKRRMALDVKRLKALRAQNAERQRREDETKAAQQARVQARVPKEKLAEERRQLEAEVNALRARLSSKAVMTPSREGRMITQAAMKTDLIDTTLALHSLQLDFQDVQHTLTYTLTFWKAFRLMCNASSGVTIIQVDFHAPAAAGLGELHPSILDTIRTAAAALGCCVRKPQLSTRVEVIMDQLYRMARVAEQLENCWMKLHCMRRPIVEGDAGGGEPNLKLRFTNPSTSTAVDIRMPWSQACRADYTKPQLSVQLQSSEPDEARRQACLELQETVLSQVQPGTDYITSVCIVMSETLQPPVAAVEIAGAATEESGISGGLLLSRLRAAY